MGASPVPPSAARRLSPAAPRRRLICSRTVAELDSPAPFQSPADYRFCTGNKPGTQNSGGMPQPVRSRSRSRNRSISMESCRLRTSVCYQRWPAERTAASESLQASRKNSIRRAPLDHRPSLSALCGERRRRRRVKPGSTQTEQIDHHHRFRQRLALLPQTFYKRILSTAK
jgi:hypothetical protein